MNVTTQEQSFIEALLDNPNDETLRLVFADWLEEHGDSRGELLRLTHTLTQSIEIPDRPALEARLRTLLQEGVQPIGPFWTNSLEMRFGWIPSGRFMMGSPKVEKKRVPSEERFEIQHKVTLSKGFFMCVHLVTQEQWQAVMGNNPSHFMGEKNLPVEQVSWEDCQEFVKKLRDKDNKPYRLPTEAEWEYACRAGTTTAFHFGETMSTNQANHCGYIYANHSGYVYAKEKKGVWRHKTTPVASFTANGFGLFDTHGNLWEWCQDWFGDYPRNDVVDPKGPDAGQYGANRVYRGASWRHYPKHCRSAFRGVNGPGYRSDDFGCRVCFSLD